MCYICESGIYIQYLFVILTLIILRPNRQIKNINIAII